MEAFPLPDARSGVLAGVRVVDAATLAAGPMVATAMAEFGADVIKVEQPGSGDPLRVWGQQKNGLGLAWKSVSRNKRCVTLDLRQLAGQEVLHRLLEVSDVLVVNARPSALERWNLAYEQLHERHPQLIVLHVTGYGRGGPSSDRPGFGTLAEALSGFAHVTGPADGPPTLPTFMLADGVASLAASYAVMLALYHRDVGGGQGQLVDVSLLEPLARLLEPNALSYDQLGIVPGRNASQWATSAPRNVYRTSDDRWLAVSSSAPAIAQRAFRAIGRGDLAEDPEYVDPVRRSGHVAEIDALVAEWVSGRTLAEAMAVFVDHGVAAAAVNDAQQLLEDEHLRARGTFISVDDPEIGTMRVQGPVAQLSDTPGVVEHLGRPLGADNDEVYGQLLGISEARREQLRADGVI